MFHINDYFTRLPGSYLFAEIARRVKAYSAAHPDADIIRLGIGDVTRPLAPAVIDAMHKAVSEMGVQETFHGYGPDYGYDFLVNAIREHDYASRGVQVDFDEVFISDGAKCDVGNIQELFSADAVIAVTDPVYPVYVDSNAMAGRAGEYADGKWDRLVYLPCNAENGFVPALPDKPVDVIYLCYPNNPTGTVLNREQLTKWVNYARENGALIIYDAAYRAFVSTPDIPLSIYEIDGAKECAIECNSFSKTAGFTGLRCAFTTIPAAVTIPGPDGSRVRLQDMWKRRQSTKYNGCPYIVQRAAEAVYSPEGQEQVRATIAAYMANAARIRSGIEGMGLSCYGGIHAPYIWVKTPDGMGSWEFFDLLLSRTSLVCTPGAGFGPSGEGYVRFTAFGSEEDTTEALERLQGLSL